MKLKNVLFIAIAILTIGLFVACNDEVVATKDNSVAYTQVLESNGAFEYNGVKYETLQDALNAIANGKTAAPEKTIKVLRSVKGPTAAIAEDQSIELDLGGNTLTFIDVKDSALTAGKGVVLAVKNGTMALDDKTNSDLVAVKAVDVTLLSFDNVNVNAEGQNSLVVDGDTAVYIKEASVFKGDATVSDATLNISDASVLDGGLDVADAKVFLGNSDTSTATITGQIDLVGTTTGATTFNTRKDTVVTGKVIASGGKDNVTLGIENELPDVDLKGATLNVASTGHVTIKEYTGSTENVIVSTEGTSAITDATPNHDIDKEGGVQKGLCKVDNSTTGYVTYYGSIKEALDVEENKGQTIILLDHDCQTDDKVLKIPYSVTIDLAGKNLQAGVMSGTSVTPVGDALLTLDDGVTLTVINSSTEAYLGHEIKSIKEGTSSLVSSSITAGNLVFMSEITLTGTLTDGIVSDGPVYSNGSTFKGAITVSGNATFNASTFTPSAAGKEIKASTLSISSSTFSGSNYYTLTATGADYGTSEPLTSALSITKSTGTVVSLTATAGSINVANGDASATLTVTGNVLAGDTTAATPVYYDVNLEGNTTSKNVIVNGDVTGKVINVDYAELDEDVTATTSFTATNSTVGNKATGDGADVVYAPVVSITDSNVTVKTIKGSDTAAADIIHLENVAGTITEASVVANSAVDYSSANNGGTTESPVYYAFYLKNADGTGALEVGTVTSEGRTATSSETTDPNQTVQAVYVNNASSSNITSTGVATSVAATSGDVYIGNSGTGTVTLSGSVSTTTSGNIKFEGVSGKLVNVYGDVVSAGAVKADYATLGNGSEDDIFASVITISNSALNLGKVMRSYTPDDPLTTEANEEKKVPSDIIHLASVAGTITEASVVANEKVDYKDNNVGTTDAPVYYAFYLSNADGTGALEVGTVTSEGRTATSSETTDPNQTVQAVYVNNSSDGNITSSGVTVEPVLTSVAATNGDVYIGKTGTGTVTINGTITGNDIVLAGVTVKESVTANNIADDPSTDANEADAGSIVATSSTFVPVDANNKLLKAETVSITDSTFDATSDRMFAINATGADTTKAALYIENTTGNVASLTATAGSIDVENGSAGESFYVYGNVLAGDTAGTTYDVTLIGQLPAKKIEVNGTVKGNDIVLRQATVKNSVTAYNVTGDSADAGSVDAVNTEFNPSAYEKEISGSSVSIASSTFTDGTYAYALTATGADYVKNEKNYSALYIESSTGKVASLTATAGSIDVKNGIADASLTVTGNVRAGDTTAETPVFYDVKLVGNTTINNVVVKGTIWGDNVEATTTTLGDGSDGIYASTVSVTNSKMELAIIKNISGKANSVSITSPLAGSAISYIITKDLSVTALDENLSVAGVTASGLVNIAGGKYTDSFVITGDQDNTISAGTFGTNVSSTYGGTFSYQGSGSLYISGVKTSYAETTRYTTFYAVSSFRNESLPASSGAVTLKGSNIASADEPDEFGLRFYDIDSLDSYSNVYISGAWVREPDGFSSLLALVNRVDATSNNVYLQYDKQDKEVLTGVHTYDFSVRPNSDASKVTVNFNSAETGSAPVTLSKGLVFNANSSTTLNFDAGMNITGKLYVRGNGLLYSSDALNGNVFGLDASASDKVSSGALPCIFDGSRYIYLTSYVTLEADTVIVAKGKLYSSSAEIGTPVTDSMSGYQYAYYSNAADTKVYAQSGTAYVTAKLVDNGSTPYSSCVLKSTLDSWGSNIMYVVWTGEHLASGNRVWADTETSPSSSWYYGYTTTTSADLGWHTGTRSEVTGHHMVGGSPGIFSSTN